MTTELDKILNDCDTLQRALARDVGDEAGDLCERVREQKNAIVAAIAQGGAGDAADAHRMWDSVGRLHYLAEQLGMLATAQRTLADAVKAAREDR